MDQIDFSAVAAQVAHPSGEDGVRTAQRMNRSNGDMTRHAVDLLNCQDGQFVLEIGPGNGLFAAYVLSKAKGISYAGTDISDTMIAEGERINRHLVESGHRIGFHKTDGLVL